MRRIAGLVGMAGVVLACGSEGTASQDSNETETSTGGDVHTSSDTTSSTGLSAGSSTANSSSGTEDNTSSGGATLDPICEMLRLPRATMQSGDGVQWGQTAGDFSVETTFGSWTLAENFSGCDTYVFVNDQGSSQASGLRSTATSELFERSALNVHYFFVTTSGDIGQGAAQWQRTIGAALGGLDASAQEHWSDRVHFVTSADGSVLQFLEQRPNQLTFAIDRAQRWDDPGSTSDTNTGGFAPSAAVLGYVGRYYNARFAQDERLAAQDDVTEVVALDNVVFEPECEGSCSGLPNGPFSNSNNGRTWQAEFPAAASMAEFDTMDVVITAECGPDPDADCGHWDYEAMLDLCDTEACDGQSHELARWITPYARPGQRRWVIDASHMLGMVRDGGTWWVRFNMVWNMNPSTWDVRLRLRDAGKDAVVTQTIPAFSGNRAFNADYNPWEPLEFTPPVGTTRVELVALISGHGQEANNCAEWCEHQHAFTVNDDAVFRREFSGDVTPQRCGDAVDDGVVPGQWGNWTPGRAGWCPGAPIHPWVVDITDAVTIGEVNTLAYEGQFADVAVEGDRGRIRLSSVLTFSEPHSP